MFHFLTAPSHEPMELSTPETILINQVGVCKFLPPRHLSRNDLPPHRLHFPQRRASVWISSANGHLQRRTDAADLRPSAIYEALCSIYLKQPRIHTLEAIAPTTVLAYLVSMVWTGAAWASSVEYFTQQALYTYLHERLRVEDRKSILQLFVPPAGPAGDGGRGTGKGTGDGDGGRGGRGARPPARLPACPRASGSASLRPAPPPLGRWRVPRCGGGWRRREQVW